MEESKEEDNKLILNVKNLCAKDVIELLNTDVSSQQLLKDSLVYHTLVEAFLKKSTEEGEVLRTAKEATKIVYTLSLHGADVNSTDQNGDTALLRYLKAAETVSDDFIVALLRCGTDCCLKNKEGQDILQYILQTEDLPKEIRARVLEYMPGLWRAVDSDDACTVRRLVNQWCHIRTTKDGISVPELAFSKGTENIIRVISGIGPSMDLAHCVLAGDHMSVQKILQASSVLNINLKNMAEMGATPLYYAICNNDFQMVDLLLKHGARLDSGMQGEYELELPLYFAVLSRIPRIHTEMLRHTIPQKPVPLALLYYKGRSVLFYCIEHEVDVDLFEDILRACSAQVLTQRIQGNIDARQYAENCDLQQYVSRIDKVVNDWCNDEAHPSNRNILCLHGYPLLLPLTTEESCDEGQWTRFIQLVQDFEEFKVKLKDATEAGDAVMVREMLNTKSWSDRGLDVCLADCRTHGDGQPLLHKAVLRGHDEVVAVIAQYVTDQTCRKLDSFKDQCFRTVLHYVYGMEDCSKTFSLALEDLGMSEYAMDKDGRSPLAFKDRRGLPEMKDLISYHLKQDFTEPEPDPWSVCMPLPITGYLKQCLHDHHVKKKKEKAMYDGIDSCKLTGSHKYQNLQWTGLTSSSSDEVTYSEISGSKSSSNKPVNNRLDNTMVPKYSETKTENGSQRGSNQNNQQKTETAPLRHVSDNHGKTSDQNYVQSKYEKSIRSVEQGENELFNMFVGHSPMSRDVDEDSELSSENSNIGVNYEGDESDVNSENEETSQKTKCCIL